MNGNLKKTIFGILIFTVFLSFCVTVSCAEEQKTLTHRQKLVELVNIASDMRNINTALYMYKADHETYPPTLNKLLVENLKDTRETRELLTSFDYVVSKDGKSYELSFNRHDWFKKVKMDKIPKGYPRLLSKVGKVELQPGVFDIKDVKF